MSEQDRLAYWGIISWPHSSPDAAHTPPQTRKGRSPVAEQLFGMYNIQIEHIVV